MNKTISASLASFVFHIEEDGYEKLQSYLNAIRSRLRNESGIDEIMTDIEGRIAELFFERTQDRKEVITLADVNEVIAIMGSPNDYAGEDASEYASEERYNTEERKRIFRNEDERMIGGVCAGIADYFDWEVTWVRIGFLAMFFFFGTGVMLYLVLWLILPLATTTAEKLQAKGQRVTSKTIEDYVKRFKKDVEGLGKKANTVRWRYAGEQIMFGLSKLFGLGTLVLGAMLSIVLIYWIITQDFVISLTNTGADGFSIANLLDVTLTSWQELLLNVGIVCVFIGPIIGLFTLSIRLFFEIRHKIKVASILSFTTWIAGLIMLGIVTIGVLRDRSSTNTSLDKIEIETSKDIVHIDIKDDIHFHNSFTNVDNYFFELLKYEGDSVFVGWPKMDIHTSHTDKFELEIIRESRGRTKGEAIKNAESITYEVQIEDNNIKIPPYFSFPESNKYKGQDVIVILRVPEGKSVNLSDRMGRVLYNVYNKDLVFRHKLAGKTWTMVGDELKSPYRNSDALQPSSTDTIE